MPLKYFYITVFAALSLLLSPVKGQAQTYTIKGMVYDSSRNNPMQFVNVFTTSGNNTATNNDGAYTIEVTESDSIWFSYLGKPTQKFPVLTIPNTMEFDVSLHVNVPTLKEVKIRPRLYKQDSLQNRLDYAKAFNYKKPGLKAVTPQYGVGAGFDLDEIINMFKFKQNRSALAFQKRLLLQEEDKFIDHRFNKALVRRLTMLEGAELDSFMQLYRPSFTFTKLAGDYDFQFYIKTAYFRFKKGLMPENMLRPEEEEN